MVCLKLTTFWKLLTDANLAGSPSELTTDEVRKTAELRGLPRHETVAVLRGILEFLKQER